MVKPEKKTKPVQETESGRRGFFLKIWLGLGVLAFGEVVWAVLSYLRPQASGGRQGRKAPLVTAGPVEDFAPNSVTAFPRGQFYLARLDAGGFLAISRRCTHLGCTVPWVAEEGHFICPCHRSVFDIRGAVVQSPAPRALDLYPVIIENNVVRVDTGSPLRRGAFEDQQVVYPKTV